MSQTPPPPGQPGQPYQPQPPTHQPYGANPYGANPYGGSPYGQPYQQPPKKGGGGKVALIVVLVVVLLIVLLCAGLGFAMFKFVENIEDLDPNNPDRPGGPENPVEVEVGEAFEIDDIEYAEGWRLQDDPTLDQTNVVGLKGENGGDESEFANLRFTFLNGTTEVAEVTCSSDGDIGVGNSEQLDCYSSESIPQASYDTIEVSTSY